MAKLKLGPIADDKPLRITLELPAALHRDLTEYGRLLAEGGAPVELAKLIVPTLERCIATDRGLQRRVEQLRRVLSQNVDRHEIPAHSLVGSDSIASPFARRFRTANCLAASWLV